jgi:hypothetical protein
MEKCIFSESVTYWIENQDVLARAEQDFTSSWHSLLETAERKHWKRGIKAEFRRDMGYGVLTWSHSDWRTDSLEWQICLRCSREDLQRGKATVLLRFDPLVNGQRSFSLPDPDQIARVSKAREALWSDLKGVSASIESHYAGASVVAPTSPQAAGGVAVEVQLPLTTATAHFARDAFKGLGDLVLYAEIAAMKATMETVVDVDFSDPIPDTTVLKGFDGVVGGLKLQEQGGCLGSRALSVDCTNCQYPPPPKKPTRVVATLHHYDTKRFGTLGVEYKTVFLTRCRRKASVWTRLGLDLGEGTVEGGRYPTLVEFEKTDVHKSQNRSGHS